MSESGRTVAPEQDPQRQLLDASLDQGIAFRFAGRPVRFTFAVANVDNEVMHMTRDVPDGVVVVDAPGRIKRAAGVQWTKDYAFLQCDAIGEATMVFVVLKEDPINVNP